MTSTSRSLAVDDSRSEPSRVLLARQRAGLTKSALAKAMAVTPRTIYEYESKGAPASALPELAQALGCTEQFLGRPGVEALSADRVFFRARRSATAAQRDAATAAGALGIELYEWIDKHFELPRVDLPEIDNSDPISAAAAVRALWALGLRPLPNLVQLAESRGVRVLSLPPGSELVDAFSVWSGGRPYVFLSMAKTPERSRFDLAHELGHLMLHPGLPVANNDIEREADRFASALLMPESSLRSGFGREPSVNDVLRHKRYFGVSAMALNYALRQAGRLTEWGHRQNVVKLSQLGYRSGEPNGMPNHEKSRVFGTIFHGREGRSRVIDAATELGIPVTDIHALALGAALHTVAVDHHSGEGSPPQAAAERPALKLVRQGRA